MFRNAEAFNLSTCSLAMATSLRFTGEMQNANELAMQLVSLVLCFMNQQNGGRERASFSPEFQKLSVRDLQRKELA
jgi:hypothetical protein